MTEKSKQYRRICGLSEKTENDINLPIDKTLGKEKVYGTENEEQKPVFDRRAPFGDWNAVF
ncbi:MAG: hypothetical protein HFI65_06050 [Lachnospiraceae bacterium]|nr:hypothetical protein [Lachnospiraceae bacterium]